MLIAIAAKTRARIRLVDSAGQVVADSHVDGPPEGVEPRRPFAGPRMSGGAADRGNRGRPIGHTAGTRPRRRGAPRDPAGARRPIRRDDARLALAALPVGRRGGRARLSVLGAAAATRPDGTVAGVVYMTRSTVPVLAEHAPAAQRALLKILLVVLAITAVLSLFLAATIARPLGQLVGTRRSRRRRRRAARACVWIAATRSAIWPARSTRWRGALDARAGETAGAGRRHQPRVQVARSPACAAPPSCCSTARATIPRRARASWPTCWPTPSASIAW